MHTHARRHSNIHTPHTPARTRWICGPKSARSASTTRCLPYRHIDRPIDRQTDRTERQTHRQTEERAGGRKKGEAPKVNRVTPRMKSDILNTPYMKSNETLSISLSIRGISLSVHGISFPSVWRSWKVIYTFHPWCITFRPYV